MPDSVSVPAPPFDRPPPPESTPERLKAFAPSTARPPAFSVKALPSVTPGTAAESAPPLAVTVPAPKAALLLMLARPPLSVASPDTSAPWMFQVPLLTVRCWKLR